MERDKLQVSIVVLAITFLMLFTFALGVLVGLQINLSIEKTNSKGQAPFPLETEAVYIKEL